MSRKGGQTAARIRREDAECWVLPEGAIEAWAAQARPGDELVYAHIPRLPHRSAAAARVRAMEEKKLVLLYQRAAEPGTFDYVARARARRPSAPPPVARIATPMLDGDGARVLQAIRFHAARGLPCPSNAAIARIAGLRDRMQASHAVAKLAKLGFVTVEMVGPSDRIITIVGSGERTAHVG